MQGGEAPANINYISEGGKDFGFGFYAADIREQALKWALRQGRIRKRQAVLNTYEFDYDKAAAELNVKIFADYTEEWLDFVVSNRSNPKAGHDFDIVFGKIANDDVGETVQAVIDGLMPVDFALKKLKFMQANSQYAFCSERALAYIKFSELGKAG